MVSNFRPEPTLAPELLKKLFGCQANEKVFAFMNNLRLCLIEDTSHLYKVLCHLFARMVCTILLPESDFTVATGINGFVEPNFHYFEVNYPRLDHALANFQAKLPFNPEEISIVTRCRDMRIRRILLTEERVRETVWRSTFLIGSCSDSATDVACPRYCLCKIDALALRYLRHSVSASASQNGRAYFCSSYEVLP